MVLEEKELTVRLLRILQQFMQTVSFRQALSSLMRSERNGSSLTVQSRIRGDQREQHCHENLSRHGKNSHTVRKRIECQREQGLLSRIVVV